MHNYSFTFILALQKRQNVFIMLVKVELKNSKKSVLVDDKVYEYLVNNAYLAQIDFIKNLREHSLGYAFFQKHWRQASGKYKVETIYLHRLIAEKFIVQPESDEPLYVQFKNGNNKDCCMKNLEWVNRSKLVRNTKYVQGKTNFRGVSKVDSKFRAVIYNKNKRISLGKYDTPEEAAYIYNKKAEELFGETRSLNRIPKKIKEELDKKYEDA